MMTKFDKLLNGEVVDGVKLIEWYDVQNYGIYCDDYVLENKNYRSWYFFINFSKCEIPYIGVMFKDVSGENDVKFYIYGIRYDNEVTFDDMITMLTIE